MRYICDVLYAMLYVRVRCFVVSGCAVSRRYINVCNSDMFSVFWIGSTPTSFLNYSLEECILFDKPQYY